MSGIDHPLPDGGGPHTELTAPQERLCQECGHELSGRKQHFCSDKCRMRHFRDVRHKHLRTVFDAIYHMLEELEIELLIAEDQQ